MKIDYSKINKKDIEQLLLDKNMNIAAADALFEFSFYSGNHPINHKDYSKAILEFLELNLDDREDKYFFDTRIVPSVKELDSKDYDDNWYRKNIRPKEYKSNNYQLTYLTFKPYQCFPYDDIKVDDDYIEVSQIGYFSKPFSYLAVLKDDVVWMSTDPNELNTMKQPIRDAKGHVLAFGLGLGYFSLMTALKEETKDVTIVEYDPEIISIFKKHILPLFPYKEKIHIVEGDAFEFTRKNNLEDDDYLFIDIWHNAEDGLPMYLRFKKLLKNKNIKVSYWLEKSILAMYRRCLLTIIEENMMGYKKDRYLQAKNDYDKIINELYFKTKNLSVSSFDDIEEILQDNYLMNLV